MADNKINVGGRLHSIATGNVLTGANEIFDDDKNKKQSEINTETYSLVNDVNEKLSGLNPEQQSALSVASKATNNEIKLGYYVCDTEGNLAAKVISNATGYILSKGGSIKVKMINANSASDATLNINSTGAKPLYYDGERASTNNSWEANETVEIYYDGTNYQANNIAGGGKFATGEKVKNVGIDSEPIANSNNLVKSSGVYEDIYGQLILDSILHYEGIGSKYVPTVEGGDNLSIRITSSGITNVNICAIIDGTTKLLYNISDSKTHYVRVPNNGSQLGIQNLVDSEISLHVWLNKITNESQVAFSLLEHEEKIEKSINDIAENKAEIESNYDDIRNAISSKILTYPSLTDSYKNILRLINDISLVVDEPFKNDVFIIDKLGITTTNYLLVGIYNATRSISFYYDKFEVSTISDNSFKTIDYEDNLCKLHISIDVNAISSSIGLINTISSNIVIDKSSALLSQFKSLNLAIPKEILIAKAVKNFQIIDNGTYSVNKGDVIITALGFTTNSSLYGYITIRRDGINLFSETFDNSTSLPTGVKTYEIKSGDIIVKFTLDWDILSSQWYNSTSSQLAVKNVLYPLDNDLANTIKTPFRNIFEFETINLNKYPSSTGVNIMDLSGFFASDFIPVEAGKIYKSNMPLLRIAYCNSKTSWSRTVKGSTSTYVFKPIGNEKFVRIGCKIADLETAIIHEVFNENDDVKSSSLELKNNAIIESDYSLMSINNTHKIVVYKGKVDTTANQILLNITSGEKLIAIPMSGNYVGKISKLKFYCECDSAFTMTLGIGNVDQRNWGLLSLRTTINVTNGLNEIDTNIAIDKGEKLFIVANSASSSANAKLYLDLVGYHQISGEDSVVMSNAAGTIMIQYTIDGVIYFNSELATKDLVANVAEIASANAAKLDGLTLDKIFITSPNETIFKLKVANDGTLSTEQIPVSGKLLIMGNSYDVHPGAEGVWWGDFGMAASRKENDWKHVLLRTIRNDNGRIYNFAKYALATWETTFENYNYSQLDSILNDNYSMVIIRVGENNTDTDWERVQSRVEALLSYVINALGASVPIILSACVKYRTEQNPSYIAAAENFDNVTYVDLTDAANIKPFNAGLDYKVFGDDGVWHTISESSAASAVANHPRDEVFAKMAELLYPVVVEKLGI